jgi:hypothetical protein
MFAALPADEFECVGGWCMCDEMGGSKRLRLWENIELPLVERTLLPISAIAWGDGIECIHVDNFKCFGKFR